MREAMTPPSSALRSDPRQLRGGEHLPPEELQKAIDTRISMGMVGDLGKYTQFQVANSVRRWRPRTKGGLAGVGAGLAAGGHGQVMMDACRGRPPRQPWPLLRQPPPTIWRPASASSRRCSTRACDQADYDSAKAEIPDRLKLISG